VKKIIIRIRSIARRLLKRGSPVSRAFEYGWIRDKIRVGSNVLDVGCVRGKTVQKLTVALVKRGDSVTGVSLMPCLFEHKNFKFIQGNVLSLDFKSGSFDSVVASHVLQHIGMPYQGYAGEVDLAGDTKFIEKVYEWMNYNGSLFVLVPFAGKFQYVSFSSNCRYRIYDSEALDALFKNRFEIVDNVTFDGAHDSKKLVKDAKAVLMELKKI
jgi:2-polyprenyl-3-methyl-5-hydroxy-6-metoxy-1,4-benzoquinol methylase